MGWRGVRSRAGRVVLAGGLFGVVGGGLLLGGGVPASAVGGEPPSLSGVSPEIVSSGAAAEITVTGANLDGMAHLYLDGQASPFAPGGSGSFQFILPPTPAGTVQVMVDTTEGGLSNILQIQVVDVPALTELVPAVIPTAGTGIRVEGTGLENVTGVQVNGSPVAYTPDTDQSLTFTAPPGADADTVQVVAFSEWGPSNPLTLTYVGAPVATSLSSEYAPAGGGPLTVHGQRLGTTFEVVVDDQNTDFTVLDDTTLTFQAPLHEAGPVNVQAKTAGGVTNPLTFTYMPTPALQGLDVNLAATEGGTPVSITGLYLAQTTDVFLDGNEVPFTQLSDTEVQFTAPPHDPGPVDVTISTAFGGPSNALPLTYQSIPGPTEPVIVQQPQDSNTLYGQQATFSITAQGEDLEYQWSTDSGTGNQFVNIPGATNAEYSFTPTAEMDGWIYFVEVMNDTDRIPSDLVTLNLIPAIITAQPQDVHAHPGDHVVFSVAATGEDLNYTWYSRTDPEAPYVEIPGANSPSYEVAAESTMSGWGYIVGISNDAGAVWSNDVTISVSTLQITTQPRDVEIAAGEDATFAVTAEGTSLTYQWFSNTGPGGTFEPISGATGTSHFVSAKDAIHNRQYQVHVSDRVGHVVSDTATLRIHTPTAVLATTGTNTPSFLLIGAIMMIAAGTLPVWSRKTSPRPHRSHTAATPQPHRWC